MSPSVTARQASDFIAAVKAHDLDLIEAAR